MQRLHVDRWRQISLRGIAKNACRAFQQLVTPLLDLVRMDVKILRQLNQSSLTLDCRYSVRIPGSSGHRFRKYPATHSNFIRPLIPEHPATL
jgi:hypothetical protein